MAYLSLARFRPVGANLGLLLTFHTLCKLEYFEPSNIKDVGSQPDPGCVGFPLRGNRLGLRPKPQRNFDKGFGNIAAASSHYAFLLAVPTRQDCAFADICSSIPKSLSTFREPCPPRRLGRRAASATGRANSFKGKAFIKIDDFKYI